MKRKLFSLKFLFIIIALVGTALLAIQLFNAQEFSVPVQMETSYFLLLVGLAVAFQMLGHWLRAYKHQYLLEQIRPIHGTGVFKGQMIGFFFNAILPFRLGEFVRAHYIGKGVSISRSAVFATILFERWLDALVLALLGLLLLATLTTTAAPLLYVTVILFTTTLVLGFILYSARAQHRWMLHLIYYFSKQFNKRTRDRIRLMFWSAIYCLKNVITPARMPRYLWITAVMWLCYLLSVLTLVIGLLPALTFLQKTITSVGAYLAVAVPSGPAYLGTFENIFSSIANLPLALPNAVYMPFVLWLLLIGPTTLLGLLFLVLKQRIYSDKKAKMVDALKNKLYRDRDITAEFSRFLDTYFKGEELSRILTTQELGDNFRVIKTFKGGSNALTLLAWQENEMVVKKITLKQYASKLRDQFDWLKSRKKMPEIAKVVAQQDTHEHYAIDIEYREEFIPFFDYIHSSSLKDSQALLMHICDFVDKRIHTPQKPVKNPARLVNGYIQTKAIGKVKDAAQSHLAISNLLAQESVVVNGSELLNFNKAIEQLTQNKQAMADLADIVDCPLHGDLALDNILVEPRDSKFIIIDPNNENAIADPLVDYSKIMQSLHSGYDFLVSLTTCTVTGNEISFEERRSLQYHQLHQSLMQRLQKQLSPARYRALLFHEAIHYCRMLTYKVTINPKTAPAFYGIAVRLLNDFLEQYKEPTDARES
ncbi:MAG TPA: lysylphosphatidylglycerol synthase transmembrane domain-containing protein [Candidatus Saccharimonadales bacterium]|nr:lysylphosphatidylglycerol synthase transmembrane domain-containing protein [Candidatus Saccharimonadales bacterium]